MARANRDEATLARGVLSKETRQQVMRLAPPQVIERDGIDWVPGQLEAVL